MVISGLNAAVEPEMLTLLAEMNTIVNRQFFSQLFMLPSYRQEKGQRRQLQMTLHSR